MFRFASLSLIVCFVASCAPQQTQDRIITVTGEIPSSLLGKTLTHEHVMVDFGGAEIASPDRYDSDDVFQKILPFLKEFQRIGGQSFIECTPAYIGRDAAVLKRLSEATGLQIITNTGYYGAGQDRYLPPHAYFETVEQLARRWIAEFEDGIEGTGIRPGFIKTGFDNGEVSEIDKKMFRAAALTHKATGLSIATHTAGNTAAIASQLQILKEEGVSPSAWIWVHAHRLTNIEDAFPAYEAGGWVQFDGLRLNSIARHSFNNHLKLIEGAKEAGYLDQTLVSHDGGWYSGGTPGGNMDKFSPFTIVFEKLVPELLNRGFTQDDIDQIFMRNPAKAFTVKVRPAN